MFEGILNNSLIHEKGSFKIIGKVDITDNPSSFEIERENKTFYTVQNWKERIGKKINYLAEESSCSYIEGYGRTNTENEIILPPAFFSKGELHKYFQNEIIAVAENRNFIDLRGNYKEGENSSLKGFIQLEKKEREKLEIIVVDLEEKSKQKPTFNTSTGIWKLELAEPLWEGFIKINKQDQTLFKHKFQLIKGIDLNVNIAGNTKVQDLYGRVLFLEQKDKTDEDTITSLYWNKDLYPDINASEVELSDKISRYITFLAPKIYIFDPFLLGTIHNDGDRPKITNKSQIIFLNSIVVALTRCKITELIIIGNSKRFKAYNDIDKEALYNNYHLFFDQFTKLSMNNIKIMLTNKGFHDRIWTNDLDQDYEKIKLLKPSNSISGIYESGEFSLDIINEKEKLRRVKILIDRIEDSVELKPKIRK